MTAEPVLRHLRDFFFAIAYLGPSLCAASAASRGESKESFLIGDRNCGRPLTTFGMIATLLADATVISFLRAVTSAAITHRQFVGRLSLHMIARRTVNSGANPVLTICSLTAHYVIGSA